MAHRISEEPDEVRFPEEIEEEHLKWAISFAQRFVRGNAPFYPPGTDIDELESAAVLFAYLALESYDPRRGAGWKTWVTRKVVFAVKEARRHYGRLRSPAYREFYRTRVSLDALPTSFGPRQPHEGGYSPLLDTEGGSPPEYLEAFLADPDSTPERVDDRLLIEEALAQLPAAQEQAIRLHLLENWELREVAKGMHLPKAQVQALITAGEERLRELLAAAF